VHHVHLDPSIAPLYLLRYSTADPLNSLSTFRANPPIVHVGHYGQPTVTQIVVTLLQLHKMAAARQHFTLLGMLKGTTTTYVVGVMNREDPQEDLTLCESEHSFPGVDEGTPVDDVHDEETLSLVTLCIKRGVNIDDYDSSVLILDRKWLSR
jgi:hypothetical protein